MTILSREKLLTIIRITLTNFSAVTRKLNHKQNRNEPKKTNSEKHTPSKRYTCQCGQHRFTNSTKGFTSLFLFLTAQTLELWRKQSQKKKKKEGNKGRKEQGKTTAKARRQGNKEADDTESIRRRTAGGQFRTRITHDEERKLTPTRHS